MIKLPDEQQQLIQIAEAAVEYQLAETKRNALRRELNTLYTTYFAAYGRPYADHRRIDPYDERFEPVLEFTGPAYRRWKDQRDLTTRLKRKLRTLVQRLERAQ
ncbi:TPA: hypothetical protein L4U07_001115 [Pseudomonas aeruginosa]|jgi:hypothetical protein|uniref:Uncharacterized protein n=4 Tax=Pseudomonas aeruginosa TaxID=287 RepID=A0A9P1R7P6_PSEAI|nr:hypothetical protein [Pseudomonas aeruginosa]QBI77336.1 hypothetical protein [Pseudomonas phage vB_Pae_CF53a]QBI77359.1 hypothetical protein [Pseudomonas phage vB_Pae_CF54a]QBI77721.1 hypothetical protein [Pseudomonas phage vB_Pae_CF121c]QBI77780.1 hypothetical protein [Pseudomonas phage vB_Pae_CF127a]QBI78033.1 hypothetical protein [Pseudomonas phage vB_Pae_CF183a]QBI78156.1 hypothetical protein [Pseudomonas phage vB_Pae_BR52a]QBI78216.1 hypothetical protein [Pseudomonas phage vB_Pae_BR1